QGASQRSIRCGAHRCERTRFAAQVCAVTLLAAFDDAVTAEAVARRAGAARAARRVERARRCAPEHPIRLGAKRRRRARLAIEVRAVTLLAGFDDSVSAGVAVGAALRQAHAR